MLRLCLAAVVLLVATATPGQGLDAVPANSAERLRVLFLQQVSQLSVPMPGNTVCGNCLLRSVDRDGFVVAGSGALSLMEQTLRARSIPDSVVQRMRGLMFGTSVHFKVFQFRVDTRVRQGHFETFVGGGRRVDAQRVEFGVIKSWAHGPLVPKTTPVQRRSCRRIIGIKRCRSWIEHVPRGNTAPELTQIERALRHHVAISARDRANSLRRIG